MATEYKILPFYATKKISLGGKSMKEINQFCEMKEGYMLKCGVTDR